jgi:hypothetical protein
MLASLLLAACREAEPPARAAYADCVLLTTAIDPYDGSLALTTVWYDGDGRAASYVADDFGDSAPDTEGTYAWDALGRLQTWEETTTNHALDQRWDYTYAGDDAIPTRIDKDVRDDGTIDDYTAVDVRVDTPTEQDYVVVHDFRETGWHWRVELDEDGHDHAFTVDEEDDGAIDWTGAYWTVDHHVILGRFAAAHPLDYGYQPAPSEVYTTWDGDRPRTYETTSDGQRYRYAWVCP